MSASKTNGVGVAIVGAGFAAKLHAQVYQDLNGHGAKLVGVASRTQANAAKMADSYSISHCVASLDELLKLDGVDVVDLCVPNQLHEPYALQAIAAGKHVIIEKPLTGYFGNSENGQNNNAAPSKSTRKQMLVEALASADRILHAAAEHQVKLMYAENWLYAPAFQKAKRLIKASGGTIFEMRGEESHHGSHSSAAKQWATSGGGALIRLGSHPLGAILHLKWCEGLWRNGTPITPRSVMADVANLEQIESFQAEENPWIVDDWVDVENWAQVIITFSDGSKATVSANDVCLGGMKDTLDIYLSNARLHCNFSRSNTLEAYAPDASVFASEYLMEKLETKAGWSFPSINEEWFLGYFDELRDFVEAIRDDREPQSDGRLGRSVIQVIYSAYLSATEGRVVQLDDVMIPAH